MKYYIFNCITFRRPAFFNISIVQVIGNSNGFFIISQFYESDD